MKRRSLAGSRRISRAGGVVAALLLATTTCVNASEVADAAMRGDTAAVQRLLESGANVNQPQADGATALQWAAYHGDAELVRLLLGAGADPSLANRNGSTAMWLAASRGDAEVLEALLDGGADVDEQLPLGRRPLMLAARSGSVDAVRLLLDRGADPNAHEEQRGTTALMQAADQGHADVIEVLAEYGADVAARSAPVARDGRTAALGNSEDPRNAVRRQVLSILCEEEEPDLAALLNLVNQSTEQAWITLRASNVELTSELICSRVQRGALGFATVTDG